MFFCQFSLKEIYALRSSHIHCGQFIQSQKLGRGFPTQKYQIGHWQTFLFVNPINCDPQLWKFSQKKRFADIENSSFPAQSQIK